MAVERDCIAQRNPNDQQGKKIKAVLSEQKDESTIRRARRD